MDNFILLPTGRPAQRGDLIQSIWNGQPMLHRTDCHVRVQVPERPANHLYQLDGTQVEEGDWCAWNAQVYKLEGEQQYYPSFKIVASTNPDPVLNLPLILKEVVDEFIKSYNHVPA